jgi:hypothetical protein
MRSRRVFGSELLGDCDATDQPVGRSVSLRLAESASALSAVTFCFVVALGTETPAHEARKTTPIKADLLAALTGFLVCFPITDPTVAKDLLTVLKRF